MAWGPPGTVCVTASVGPCPAPPFLARFSAVTGNLPYRHLAVTNQHSKPNLRPEEALLHRTAHRKRRFVDGNAAVVVSGPRRGRGSALRTHVYRRDHKSCFHHVRSPSTGDQTSAPAAPNLRCRRQCRDRNHLELFARHLVDARSFERSRLRQHLGTTPSASACRTCPEWRFYAGRHLSADRAMVLYGGWAYQSKTCPRHSLTT